jgi:hypothetical protein
MFMTARKNTDLQTETGRINYKKKTPFTQWCNANFNMGVFFNPPESGI